MKIIILAAALLIGPLGIAGVQEFDVPAKVIGIDSKTVTLEILNKKYAFNRDKLGDSVKLIHSNDTIYISVNASDLKNQ